jgi:hypothetical protein
MRYLPDLKINGRLVIFHNPNKWNGKGCSRLRLLSPFVMLLDGLIELMLLPTPYSCHIYNNYLRAIIKADMTYRIKKHDKNKKQPS